MRLLIITQKVDKNDDIMGFFHEWIRHISKEVDSIRVICLTAGENDLPENVKVYSLGRENGYPRIVQAFLFYFYAIKSLFNVDGVFVHMAPEYVRALYPVNIFFRKRIVMWYAHIKVSPIARWAEKHVYKILSPSRDSFDIETDKVMGVGHGIDVDVFKPTKEREVGGERILTLSRISHVKRIEDYIEAVNILVNEYGRTGLVASIVGGPARPEDYKYVEELKTLVSKYGIEKNILWVEPVSNKDTVDIYNYVDLFVRTQGGGGFGKTELEAFACGTPVVLPTAVYKDYFEGFFDDLYYEEGDIKELSKNIDAVLSWDNEKMKRFREHSRSFVVENHNLSKLSKKIVNAFE